MKKKLISAFAICSMLCCVTAGVAVNANADDYSNAIVSIDPLAGASVRINLENEYYNGIRFQATVDKSVYDSLEESETATRTVDYGMIVAPLDYEAQYGAFTKENLFGESRKYFVDAADQAEGLVQLGGGTMATLSEYEENSDKMILSGSLLNIVGSQLTREFVGVPYICITENDVKEYYVVGYKDARSMVYVAQRAINDTESGLTEDELAHLSTNYVNFKDEEAGIDIASKQYAYTVEHIALDPEGNEVEVLESVTADKTTIGTTVSVDANQYANYTYNAGISTTSDIVYANNRTTLKLYYVQDHVKISVLDSTYGEISPEDNKYAGKSYALKEDGRYTFVVTPPAEFNKATQQLYAFVNGGLWIANGTEGKYTIDLSSYENGSELKLSCMVDSFGPLVEAGKGTYTSFVSVTPTTQSDNSVTYTYENQTSGKDGDKSTNQNWGESGMYFPHAYDTRLNANQQRNVFFSKGYKYVRFDAKFENATSYSIRVENTFYHKNFGDAYDAKSGIVRVVNRANTIVTTIAKDVWYTFYLQPTMGKAWMMWANGGSAETPSIMEIANVEYLEELPNYNVNLHMRINGQLPERDASLEYKVDGDFAGAWKYTNGTLGTTNGVWGEAGIFFNEIYNGNTGYGAGQTFFNNGYKYVKLDFYAEESVYSISMQNAWSVGANYRHLTANTTLPANTAFAIYDADGNKVDKWTAGAWYTLVIKPDTANPVFRIQTNAETKTSEAPVMYVKNVSYEKAKPFPTTTLSVNTAKASLEMQTEGDFAGAYKYTNWSLGRGTNQSNGTGIYFNEVFSSGNGGANQTFFNDGYQYIVFDFYAEESVYSLELQIGSWSVNGNTWIEQVTAGKTFNSDYVSIYNQNGEKVNSWTAGEWYTMVIKPLQCPAANAWEYPLNIQTNAQTATSAAPVMYVKNATYAAEFPFAN